MSQYRTVNFLADAPTTQIAQQVALRAEQCRREKAVEWLGEEMPAWPNPCPIHVRLANHEGGGATMFDFRGWRVGSQDMTVEGRLDAILANVVPHEVTHTVFAHHFGSMVPRWADEGAATLSESLSEYQRQESAMRSILSQRRHMPLRRLFGLWHYPEGEIQTLYAQGFSLCRFLVALKGRREFLAFVRQGMKNQWDAAVTSHYGYANVEALEADWIDYCFGRRGGASPGPGTRPGTTAPGPTRPAPPSSAPAPLDLSRVIARIEAAEKAIGTVDQTVKTIRAATPMAGPAGKDGQPGKEGSPGPQGLPGPVPDLTPHLQPLQDRLAAFEAAHARLQTALPVIEKASKDFAAIGGPEGVKAIVADVAPKVVAVAGGAGAAAGWLPILTTVGAATGGVGVPLVLGAMGVTALLRRRQPGPRGNGTFIPGAPSQPQAAQQKPFVDPHFVPVNQPDPRYDALVKGLDMVAEEHPNNAVLVARAHRLARLTQSGMNLKTPEPVNA